MTTLQYRILTVASLFGAVAVLFGALGAHYLKTILDLDEYSSFETGVRFQMYHAIVLLVIAVLAGKTKKSIISVAFYIFVAGMLFFSFSIYLFTGLSILDIKINGLFRLLTPLGGLLLTVGWGLLFYSGFRSLYLKRRAD